MRAVENQRIVIAGRQIEFGRIEPERPNAPTLVFLHEGLGSVALWRDVPAELARRTGCGALVYSRYGNGFSEVLAEARTAQYMHEEARVLPVLLDTLAIGETVLVGHSDGASIALLYAAERPERLRGLVLEAPHVFVEELSVRSIAAIRGEFETGTLAERMTRYHADAVRTFYGWNDIWLAPAFRDWNIEAAVDRIAAPIFVIQGSGDEYGSLAQVDAIARRANAPVNRLVLARCGHAPHRDRAAFVEDAIAGWLMPLTGLG